MSIGQKIKKLRDDKNWSQGQLALALKKHQTTVSLYELDKRKPGRDTLIKLSLMFKVPMEYFVDNENIAASSHPKKSVDLTIFPSELNLKLNEIAQKYKKQNNGEPLLTIEEAEQAIAYIEELLSMRHNK
ncbi:MULTISPECIES: helix-turn-helix domain-containing protein [Bacillus]|uniref:Helix-turn-helix transcriptional regulator n=1 Tax=Bacillus glycinifermentans TaxID=1664069 RepID=A0A0T6BI35_9BACI|nr:MULTISPECIES: helix-turn-helix transcriptional regulator [Bacillus]KRT87086.1 hypothetical protein AB447_208955 [Bacillus glycinifermentans]MEC0341862.1 helix-turn-helix transcriptional regulator [Bacillus sonorensis]MEC0457452.1 helix-turn-helix transcriptional regulator [Bacillus sonorensis]MEC0487135.1 helix-turn-helix transcriptional regulator [Bacillus glycinifermentans]MEC0530753.1 helix-turn-helix transcriptional regulator [Bacillus sonorensis]